MASLLNKISAGDGSVLFRRALTCHRLRPVTSPAEPPGGAPLLPWEARRAYRRHPTHDIGRFQFMLQKLQGKGRKAKAKPDPIWTSKSELMYDTLNVRLSGHDVVLVGHFARYAHLLCNRLGVSVVESYALPTRTLDVLLQDQGTKMVVEASLSTHSRVIQVARLSSTLGPVLLEVLQLNQPEGVALDVSQVTHKG
uniref:39S ribosomal protein L48, mitochondrial n=1 Tax=Petromyzon marinus TaxID=7757 RepID=A0AAJ7XJB6_PETMA